MTLAEGVGEVELYDMHNKIGQMAFQAPSVFGFYLPEYAPAGPIGSSGLVGPEAQLATAPLIVGFLNGVAGLIDVGLSSCNSGFGASSALPCYRDEMARGANAGSLAYMAHWPSGSAEPQWREPGHTNACLGQQLNTGHLDAAKLCAVAAYDDGPSPLERAATRAWCA